MTGEQEVFSQCPYCMSPITFLCELFYGGQSYIEDCEVCCRPIKISYEVQVEEGHRYVENFVTQTEDE